MDVFFAWVENHPGLAAWMQAVGSIGALLIAIAIPLWERRRTEQAAALSIMEPLQNSILSIVMSSSRLPLEPRFDLKLNLQALQAGPIDRLSPALNFQIRGLLNSLNQLANGEEEVGSSGELAEVTRRMWISRIIDQLRAITRINSKLAPKRLAEALKAFALTDMEETPDRSSERPKL